MEVPRNMPHTNRPACEGAVEIGKSYIFRLGVNNLADKDPPLIPSGPASSCPVTFCNGNTWPQVYDSLGRYVYARFTAQF